MHSAKLEEPFCERPLLPGRPTLLMLRTGDGLRTSVESFIRGIYARTYNATVREFAPILVCLQVDGQILAAAGYRLASEPLYLERYLDHPVEKLLGSPTPIARHSIAEVGHLASLQPGASRQLMRALAAHLDAEGVEWVASTVTAPLRHVFIRLGLGARVICAAPAAALGDAAADWGSYFEHAPLVMAGHLPTARQALARRLDAK